MSTLLTMMGNKLPDHYYKQLEVSSKREFGVRLPTEFEMGNWLYFLLVERETILASAFLRPVYPVICNHEIFSLLDIGEVIANEKGKGYGKQVVCTLREYLLSSDTVGLGFCFPQNQGFYEKCGLKVDTLNTRRIIYRSRAGRQTAEGQCILYQDSRAHFLETLLVHGDSEIFVPDPLIW